MFTHGNSMIHMDQYRKMDTYSHPPKSSPQGGSSSVISTEESLEVLKATISVEKNPSNEQTGPFYLLKEPTGECELTGSSNLLAYYGLERSYNKITGKKVKEHLSSFLPNLSGVVEDSSIENSTLCSVVQRPPICGKQLLPLNTVQLAGFRLHSGTLPEEYLYLNKQMSSVQKHKTKSKKRKHKEISTPSVTQIDTDVQIEPHEKKYKKRKRDADGEPERKKRKKEKKSKKQRHSHDRE